jgi:hypothetical protein
VLWQEDEQLQVEWDAFLAQLEGERKPKEIIREYRHWGSKHALRKQNKEFFSGLDGGFCE